MDGIIIKKDGDKVTELQELNEKKKEYLNSYKSLCRKLKSLEEQLLSLREIEQSAKIQQLTDMPKGSKQTDLSDYMVKLDNIVYKVIKTKQECMVKKMEIESRIADMPDGVEADILRKRYLEFKSWEEICVELNYSWRQTHRLHSRALSNFSMN